MSWDHETTGWDRFETALAELKAEKGVSVGEVTSPVLDMLLFRGRDNVGEPMYLRQCRYFRGGVGFVLEEYLAVDDGDCDGESMVDIVQYEEGRRPTLYRTVLWGGMFAYPGGPPGRPGITSPRASSGASTPEQPRTSSSSSRLGTKPPPTAQSGQLNRSGLSGGLRGDLH
jgi:hypothetical protein